MNEKFQFDGEYVMPVLPLRGLTIFPGMMLNFDVERQMSTAALNNAVSDDRYVFLSAQKDVTKDIPQPEDIYDIGTVCRIKQILRQPGSSTIRVMAEGVARGRVVTYLKRGQYYTASIEPLKDKAEKVSKVKMEALLRRCCTLFAEYLSVAVSMPEEALLNIIANADASYVSYYISQNVILYPEDKQKLLEEVRPSKRLTMLASLLSHTV